MPGSKRRSTRGQRLDKTLWLALAPREAFADGPGAPEEWDHTLTGAMAEFWSAFGGEALFGRPLTEPFRDDATGARLHLFENALVEDTGAAVWLRPLADDLAEGAGLLANDSAFQSAPPTGGQTVPRVIDRRIVATVRAQHGGGDSDAAAGQRRVHRRARQVG